MSSVCIEVEDAVAIVTLNEPSRRNALTLRMVEDIETAFDRVEANAAIRAVVLIGAGSAFCAGADLQVLLAGDSNVFRRIYEAFLRVRRCPLPTIAAVHGAAAGAGLNLVLACDLCITAPSAKFQSRFLEVGLHPGGGHSWMLVRTVGIGLAKAMLLFNQELDGESAVAAGLSFRCVPAEKLVEEAKALARQAAAAPRPLLERTKDTIEGMSAVLDHEGAVEIEAAAQAWSTTLPYLKERLEALQKQIAARAAAR